MGLRFETEPREGARPSVLLVDDTPANLIALAAVLKPLGADLVEASSGAEALEEVARREFAVALVDVQMPEMDGFELAARIRRMNGGRELPIIFLTAIHRDDTFVRRGYASGAADYITKPFDAEVVCARVKAFVDLFEQREAVRRAQVAVRTEERDDAVKKLVAFERIATAALVETELSSFLRALCVVFMDAAETADSVCIFIREGEILRQDACLGLNEEVDQGLLLRFGEGFAGKVAALGEPQEISGACRSPLVQSTWLRERGTDALYGVPLVHEKEVVGVAYVGSKSASAFPDHEKSMFRALAQRAGMAIGQHAERTRLLELERCARIEAEQVSRMKDDFLAVVSHELRTPLNAILGWALNARAKAPPEIDRALAIIERNARAQARIVDDVLDVSRIAAGKLQLAMAWTSVEAVMERALETVRHAADAKHLQLLSDIEPDVFLRADGQRLEQVVGNLLSNAVKFSPRGAAIELTARQDGNRVVIVVADRGEGIHPDFLPHVFEAFRQADSSSTRRHGGLGLGLSIVHRLICAHGGEIVATSPGPGKGATFTVSLPVGDDERANAQSADEPSGRGSSPGDRPLPLDGIRVLVVDDDDDARTLLEDVLRERGAEVTGVGSAREGLAAVVRTRPDLVISDIAMPGGDGYELVRSVRALGPEQGGETPAIAVTAHTRDGDGKVAIAAGFQAYLPKPVELDALVARAVDLCRTAARRGRRGRRAAHHARSN